MQTGWGFLGSEVWAGKQNTLKCKSRMTNFDAMQNLMLNKIIELNDPTTKVV
jgi:hypothetical protein